MSPTKPHSTRWTLLEVLSERKCKSPILELRGTRYVCPICGAWEPVAGFTLLNVIDELAKGPRQP
jgi:hypothetical protein